MAKTERIQYMTKGSPAKLIFTFAIPLMLGNVFQQFYTVVDTAIVGQALGVNALAALGAADYKLNVKLPDGTSAYTFCMCPGGEVCAAAAEAVGANALLARVGAYYHDIGKLIRPMYFKENQMGENPHDKTDPRVSTAILTEHTRDGVELARKHRLPEPIIDMIRQHHGDTPVMYFYAKAVKMLGEENVDIRDFRYDGPKPQTAEAAILMLSDTVEAAVRALPDPTQEKISALIRKLVRGKMEDGQLDECTLTFRDIGKICSAFETVLQGVFHERIEYPSVDLSRAQHHSEQKQAEQKTEAKP